MHGGKPPSKYVHLPRVVKVWRFAFDFQLNMSRRRGVPSMQTSPPTPQTPADITATKMNEERLEKDRIFGKWLKDEMVSLGPAFMKMGQFMSTRTDVFGSAVTAELSKLQDNSNEVPFEAIKAVIDAEYADYNKTVDDIFESIDPIPLASASIGQVHRGRLRLKGGGLAEVVIKVQKPNVRQQILADLASLTAIASFMSQLGAARGREFQSLLRQYDTFLQAELDFKREVRNMQMFREANGGASIPGVIVPRPFPSLSTTNVLVMEYVPSIKVTDEAALAAAGIPLSAVAAKVVDAFLNQITIAGIVHCDPHPGNIGVLANSTDPTSPTIVLYDFGNVVELTPAFRSQITNLVVSVYQQDVDEFLDLLVNLGILRVSDPLELLEMRSFFVYFFEYLKSVDFDRLRTSIMDNEQLQESNVTFKIDNDFLALVRVFSLLDGTCTRLDPNFNYIDALAPISQEAFQDFGFLDYRARKDMSKLNLMGANSSLKNTETTLVALNSKMRNIGDRTNLFRGLFAALALMDCLEDPLRLVVVAPVIAWMVLAEKK
jgi:predicted unusual protein kinase regulating ubiquinone biosynthesis (AarF/ABC1/UbiB family)